MAGVAACTSARSSAVAEEAERNVIDVAAGEAIMTRAIAGARGSVAGFLSQVAPPAVPYEYAAIKVRLSDEGKGEHLWARDPAAANGMITAILDNPPVYQPRRHVGDTVRVAMDSISDWMLVRGDTVFGAFTVYALRDAMPPAKRRAFEKEQREQGMTLAAAPRVLPVKR